MEFSDFFASLSLRGLRALGTAAADEIDGRMGIIVIVFITYCLWYALFWYGYRYNSG